MNKILVVAAHPDDEALGAGATIHRLAEEGDDVYVCLMSHWCPTRYDNLKEGIEESHKILGVKKSYIGECNGLSFKDVDHHSMVMHIEDAIQDCCPNIIITHHPADINPDHQITTQCCLEAAKLPQRQIVNIPKISKIWFMEVPSSTDWNVSTANGFFIPNCFVAVNREDIDAKVKSIEMYDGVIREFPHPRSVTYLSSLAQVRGSKAGLKLAEAFQVAFELEVMNGETN